MVTAVNMAVIAANTSDRDGQKERYITYVSYGPNLKKNLAPKLVCRHFLYNKQGFNIK